MNENTWDALENQFSERPDLKAEPVSEAEFHAAMVETGSTSVSDDYRQFVLRYGAAQLGIYTIYGLRILQDMGRDEGTFIEMTSKFREVQWPEIENWIIISIDQSGNPIGLDENGQVWVSDTHCTEIPLLIAQNFEEFLLNECLKDDEDEYQDYEDVEFVNEPFIEDGIVRRNIEANSTSIVETKPRMIDMVAISAGIFNMGSTEGDNDEQPVHSVQLSPFFVAQFPVTWEKWCRVKERAERNGYIFINPGRKGGGSSKVNEIHPVTEINWYDSLLWCNALSEMEGRTPCYYTNDTWDCVYRKEMIEISIDWINWKADGYRIPTEAEWECACRAGTITEYHFGDTISRKDANYDGKYGVDGTTPVGQYKPNNWGLYDMHGNITEWCWDWYGKKYYKKSPTNNPMGPPNGTYRILRGGGWFTRSQDIQSSKRRNALDFAANDEIGFRPVCSLP